MLRRGEIHWASVTAEQSVGTEERDHDGRLARPWLVVSANHVGTRAKLFIAIPLSSSASVSGNLSEFRVLISPDLVLQDPNVDVGECRPTVALCEQMRAMSLDRLVVMRQRSSRLGRLADSALMDVERAMYRALGLRPG